MQKIEHIGIAVKNLEESEDLFYKLLGKKPYKREEVASEKVVTSFFEMGESKIELLAGLDPSSPVSRFIEKKGEGIHHIAYAVKNIEKEIQRLKAEGFEFISETPKKGADNKLICFIHPRSASGILVELCQEI